MFQIIIVDESYKNDTIVLENGQTPKMLNRTFLNNEKRSEEV